jgi:S1-C subfamily serine protease
MAKMKGLLLGVVLLGYAGTAQAQTKGAEKSPQPPAGAEEVRTEVAARGELGFRYRYDEVFVWRSGETHQPSVFPKVERIAPGGPATRAGLVDGDVLLSVNGRDAREPRLFSNRRPGTRYVLRIRRGSEERETTLVIGPPRAGAR